MLPRKWFVGRDDALLNTTFQKFLGKQSEVCTAISIVDSHGWSVDVAIVEDAQFMHS